MPKYKAGEIEPCRVFDANGLRWTGITEMDTDTGELTLLVRDEEGDMVIERDENWSPYVATEVVKVAAPLLCVPEDWYQGDQP